MEQKEKVRRVKKGFTIQEIEKCIKNNERKVFYPEIHIKLSKKDDGGSRPVYTYVMTEELRDRAHHVVKLSGGNVERYNLNPIISFMHETERGWYDTQPYDPDYVIGKGHAYLQDGKWMNDIQFETLEDEMNIIAEKVTRKINFGSLSAGSMGFIPLKGHWGNPDQGEDSGTYYISEWELLEFAIVVIPCLFSALHVKNEKSQEDPHDPDPTTSHQDPEDPPSNQKNKGYVSQEVMAMNLNIFNSQNKNLLCQN